MRITDNKLDKIITEAVKQIHLPLPGEGTAKQKSRIRKGLWLTVLAAAAVIVLIIFPPYSAHVLKNKEINEIRTELTLKNKKLKILWIQKRDFKLPESMRGGK